MKRFRITSTLAVLAVALSLVNPAPATATFPGKNGWIAFGADTASGTQLFTVRRNGHHLTQITHGPGEATTPDLSPDGRWLAYSLDECTIALVRADETDQRVIASQTPGGCETDPAFTPDGDHLVFERYDAVADDDAIWIMDLQGHDRRRIDWGPTPN
jgi:Tol biopolymer transport system component